jgi:hypothetical protein
MAKLKRPKALEEFSAEKERAGSVRMMKRYGKLWNTDGKNCTYEYKYCKGGKTLCYLFAKSNCLGFMIILGKGARKNMKI